MHFTASRATIARSSVHTASFGLSDTLLAMHGDGDDSGRKRGDVREQELSTQHSAARLLGLG